MNHSSTSLASFDIIALTETQLSDMVFKSETLP